MVGYYYIRNCIETFLELLVLQRNMPQESLLSSIFASPHKRGLNLKGSASVCNNNEASYPVMAEESINDHELAQRKAGEAGINF